MKKLLISILCGATLVLGACSLGRFPWVHRIDIPQGNIVTQSMVNRLKPGMTEAQVRFILGTPLLVDPFRPDRWDYVYRNLHPDGKVDKSRVSVYFHDQRLARIDGTLKPQPNATPAQPPEQLVKVPPREIVHRGVLDKLWAWIQRKR
jgi:outer membrane protein assembly factor BamE